MELIYDDFGTGLTTNEMTYLLIEGSRKFTEVYFFVSTIAQMQRQGFIGKYVTIPVGSEKPFLELDKLDFKLDEIQVDDVLSQFEWDTTKKEKMKSFYFAYRNTDYFKKQLDGRNNNKTS